MVRQLVESKHTHCCLVQLRRKMNLAAMRAAEPVRRVEQLQAHSEGGLHSITRPSQCDIVPVPGPLDQLEARARCPIEQPPQVRRIGCLEAWGLPACTGR